MSKIPFVEAHRPKHFDDIVLDHLNKKILKNIIQTAYFPNLLFYGPPGTGKTTTIINLINSYQEKVGVKNKDLIIHLNASDERGIDIIRNQISCFVNSNPLFNSGLKFVILDEVDYMTKNAQQALRYLLQNYSNSVRFCLICNYISKIDEGLQNEFIRLRFNQLPNDEIIKFLQHISNSENLNLTMESLSSIQKLYKSDIRSMINFIQTNQDILKNQKNDKYNIVKFNIIDNKIWENILIQIKDKKNIEEINLYIHNISINYNIDKKNIIKDFINYIIRNKSNILNSKFFNFVENLMHSQNLNNHIHIYYSLSQLSELLLDA
uniref:AAA+ ATPase domain-containing protein n=1 Tax=viral metagenome TaxID=1070528 RepID=A0A6C0ESL6_9ZZZZ